MGLSACVVVAPVGLPVAAPVVAPPPVAAAGPAPCAAPPGAAAARATALAQINAERRAAGLAALAPSAALQRAAQSQACDNAARDQISHVGADGSDLRTRLARVGYGPRVAAENTYMGGADPAATVGFWMRSAGHRSNILLPAAREAGLGLADGARRHWVMVAAAPR